MFYALLRLLCVSLGLIGAASAADAPFRVEAEDATVAPGGTVQVRLNVIVPDGFHVYRDMLGIKAGSAGTWTVGAPSYPPGLNKPDPANAAAMRELYESDVLIDVPVTAPADATGQQAVSLDVTLQGCKKGLCYPPQEESVTALVTVSAAGRPGPPGEEVPVTFTAVAGGPDTVQVRVDLKGEWHLNKAMMHVSLDPPPAEGVTPPIALGEPVLPAGVKTGSEADFTLREDLHEDFDLLVPVAGPAGSSTLKIALDWQACKGVSLCMMPKTTLLEVPIVLTGGPLGAVTAAAVPAAVVAAAASPNAASPNAAGLAGGTGAAGFAAAAASGTGALLLLCFLAGVGVSFTPCVLPMVPITMGIIGARGAGSRVVAVSLSSAYVLGLALVYSALGVFAGVTGQLFGGWMQSTWLVGGIAGFFFLMGLAMFGAFEVGIPSAIASRLSGRGGGGSYGGALMLGMIGAVLAGPCSGPVVASILAIIGKEGRVAYGAMLMVSFSVGMGMIFLVTGAASGWLPARGPWMDVVKKGFGVAMWLGAIYYVAPHLSIEVTALLTAAAFLSTAVFAWPSAEDGEGFFLERVRQLYSVVAVLIGGYLLVGTLMREGFILPPAQGAMPPAAAAVGIRWLPDEKSAIERALAEGKPMMIDFTAEWCAACHEMERYTYTDPRVITAANGFVTVMIDCTAKADPTILAIQKKYGVTGLPTVVFAKADGTMIRQTIGFVEADDFLPEMKAALGESG